MSNNTASIWTSRQKAVLQATVLENKYCVQDPTPKQAAFLALECEEAFYGGAGGGGKSSSLLTGGLQYVGCPSYSALILRRTYPDLWLPGALMERAQEWLEPTDAKWHQQEHTWRFPSGAALTFGYLQYEKDKYRYASAEFQYIAFDELTQFTRGQYTFLRSRLRRPAGSQIPLRIRGAANPGGIGHDWVQDRFNILNYHETGPREDRIFIPARLGDNPHIDRKAYEKSLEGLDPVDRARIRDGDWTAREEGGKFKREWFKFVDVEPSHLVKTRAWDLAATEPKPGKDPDYTVGVSLGKHPDDRYFITDIARTQTTPGGVENLIHNTAVMDGIPVDIWIEQEGGASGVMTIDSLIRKVLPGFTARGQPASRSKQIRANPVSSQAEAGNIYLVRGPWNEAFLQEAESFPNGVHDDQVDALSLAFSKLCDLNINQPTGVIVSTPRLDPFEGMDDNETPAFEGM